MPYLFIFSLKPYKNVLKSVEEICLSYPVVLQHSQGTQLSCSLLPFLLSPLQSSHCTIIPFLPWEEIAAFTLSFFTNSLFWSFSTLSQSPPSMFSLHSFSFCWSHILPRSCLCSDKGRSSLPSLWTVQLFTLAGSC